jgi:hypothetical protein
MERLTESNYRSLAETYSTVYNEDLRSLNEEQENIQEFLQVIGELVEEGYDLSEYTYDELYEHYLSEGGLGTVLKALGGRALAATRGAARTAWRGTVKQTKEGPKVIPGAKATTKEILAKTGKVAPWVALGLAADQALTGGAGREWLGRGAQAAKDVGHSIPKPDKPQTTKPKPEEPKKPKSLKILGGQVVGYEDFDLFDVIKGHLLDEGYADTEEAAFAIMANMSEDWRQSIVESDSIEAMKARAAKRRQQRYGKNGGGGRDDFRPYTKDDYDNPKPGYGSGASSQAKDA